MRFIAIFGFAISVLVAAAYFSTIVMYGLPLAPSEEVGNHGSWRNTWYREYYDWMFYLNIAGLILSSVSWKHGKKLGTWSISVGAVMIIAHVLAFLAIFD